MTSKENYKKLVGDNRIWFGETGQNVPALKKFLSEVQQGTVPSTIWFRNEVGDNQEAKNEIKELFEYPPFDTPKPTRLIDRIIHLGSDKQENDDIILDFFAGSATTGHSVYLNNVKKKKNNRYILVQLPEEFNSKNKNNTWENLAEVSRERLKQASYGIKEKKPKIFDLGFQVFQLTRSHYNSWQNYSGQDVSQLETLFSQFEDPLVQGWTKEGLLSEVMLLEGFPLDSQIEELSEYSTNKIYKVSSDFHEHSLLVCLDDKIQAATIQQLNQKGNDVFICLDRAINDQDKLRLSDKGVIKTI